MKQKTNVVRNVAFIGNHLPRQCGIATFTTDLCQAISNEFSETNCFVLAMNDSSQGYNYPPVVRFELAEQDLTAYQRAADFLNTNGIDLVCLQHEFGIFGGKAGSHILALLRELRMPVVTTLHTVLREPDPNQQRILEDIASLSDRLIVMSQRGSEFLQTIYNVPADKIDIIPHGIPDVPFIDPNFYKDQFGVEGRYVLLTFGLLSPNKGIEDVIHALPEIIHQHPNVVYIILGATHPHVRRREGEVYRLGLQRLAQENDVADRVIFYDRFVALKELVEFIGAADIYLTPYLNPAQIVSGTLAYTLGAGKAIISTPYWYAEEMLAEGRGVLVPFNDPKSIAEQVNTLLDNEPERHAIRKRAYLFGRDMIWSRVAHRYMESFLLARRGRAIQPRPVFFARTLKQRSDELPQLKLDHLQRMTDDTGLLQHAIFTIPNYATGYTTDDNARALLLTVLLEELEGQLSPEIHLLAARYLAFLAFAFNPETGRFRNNLSYDRRWLENIGSEDCHARAIWSLGAVLGRSSNKGLRGVAARLFEQAVPITFEFEHPHAWAITLLGIYEYLRRFTGDRVAHQIGEELAERLLTAYYNHHAEDWRWFGEAVTYSNARLPQALLLSGHWLGRDDMKEVALTTLSWLADLQRGERGQFVPVGNHGFFQRSRERPRFDQQPIEANAMVSACLTAYQLTDDEKWLKEARRAFEWFLGENDLRLPLYDSVSGGCRDGLHADRPNQNQGAESTLTFLLALVEMKLAQHFINRITEQTVEEPLTV